MAARLRTACGVAASLAAGILAGGEAAATDDVRRVQDGCEVGAGGNDIHSLESSYDRKRDQITVTLRLCADAAPGATYRLHLDHAAPFVEQAAAGLGCTTCSTS